MLRPSIARAHRCRVKEAAREYFDTILERIALAENNNNVINTIHP